MKFNGELLLSITLSDRRSGEPDEFVIVANEKSRGGVIPYARYGQEWTANPVPARPLIRALAKHVLALQAHSDKMFEAMGDSLHLAGHAINSIPDKSESEISDNKEMRQKDGK